MVIGLYGIGGVYNYGCEAIIRGTVKLLKKSAPNCHVIYYSRRADEDRKRLEDLEIDIYQVSVRLSLVKRIANRLFRKININYRLPVDNFRKMCKDCGLLMSIGGDIYTIPEYMRKQNKYPYYNSMVQFGDTALKMGRRLVIYGASIGPFGSFKKANEYYFKHMSKVSLIAARETHTFEYLKENGIVGNLCMLPDPAFYVEDEKAREVYETDYIGINLSPLSLREIYGGLTLEHKKRLSLLISQISRKTGMKIMLIPHVISPVNPLDNDLIFLEEIMEMADDDVKDSICLVRDADGFIGTKKYLRSCRVVVAARMHCAISAICESVPSIFLSYSAKSRGMANFVYGNEKWVLPLNRINQELTSKIEEMLEISEKVKDYLGCRIMEIRVDDSFGKKVGKLLDDVNIGDSIND